MKHGWKCPACLAVNGPHVDRCGCTGPGTERAHHYGVKYHSPWSGRPTYLVPGPVMGEWVYAPRIHVLLACGAPIMGAANYLASTDWNLVTCRRCMRSRVAAAAGPHAGQQFMSGSAYTRIALISSAPTATDGRDFIVGEPQLFEGHWRTVPDDNSHYGKPPHVDPGPFNG